MFSLFAFSLLGLFASSALAAPSLSKRASVCNGHAELCDRSYGNVTFIGSHDSFAYSTDPLALARDQEIDVPSQLNLGVRLLQAQSHMNDGVLHFCHTSCILFDGGSVQNYLTTVKTWLDAHPNEVLTFVFTNPENVSLKDVWDPAFQASGIAPLAYVPPSTPVAQSDWPTLGSLIDSGKRVVVFMDYGAEDGGVDYILPEFEMIWETPFSQTDASFPCKVDRTEGPLADDKHMYMINHSLNYKLFGSDDIILPDYAKASTTNGRASILAHSYGCGQFAGGRAPNFILMDWVDIGQAYTTANYLNGFA